MEFQEYCKNIQRFLFQDNVLHILELVAFSWKNDFSQVEHSNVMTIPIIIK